jgi:hypothetical protein
MTQPEGVAQVVESLSSKHEALSSNPSTAKTKEDPDNIYLENANIKLASNVRE